MERRWKPTTHPTTKHNDINIPFLTATNKLLLSFYSSNLFYYYHYYYSYCAEIANLIFAIILATSTTKRVRRSHERNMGIVSAFVVPTTVISRVLPILPP